MKELDELMNEVRMGTAMSSSLGKAAVLLAFLATIDAAGGKGGDFIGQEVGVVWRFDTRRDFGFGFLGGVKDEGLTLDEGPFDAFFGAIDFDGFAILAGHVKERAINETGEVGVLKLDVAALDSKGRVVALVHFLADGAGGKAGNIFGFMSAEAKKWSDAVGGVVHGREAGPVSGPAVHVLLVGSFEKLEFAEFTFVVEFLHEEEFPGVNHGFHHHVFETGGLGEFDNCLTIFDRGRHGDGAGYVFSGLQGCDGLFSMIGDGRIDVNGIDVRIGEEVVVALVALLDPEFVAHFIEGGLGALANCHQFSSGVALIDGDEFGAKTEADDCDTKRFI